MKLKIIFFFSILIHLPCVSQNMALTGIVNDSDNSPIAYANVTLSRVDDGSFLYGTSTNEEGKFLIEDIKSNSYSLKITYLGFKDYKKVLNIDENLDLGIVRLTEKTEELNGVVVTAKRPTVKRLVDRLVFNVENSTLSENNVLDVLKHTPGVILNNETITIKNKVPVIYINDRRVHLSANEVQQLLEGTSATNVKSIEVITNPPAKYEAEGGAVLNIITSKNVIAGYNGNIFGNYKQGFQFPKYSVGTSHFFKTKKLNTYINYNISPRKDFRNNDEFINFIDNDAITSSWETDYKRTRENANQNINANIDYELDKSNSIGLSTNILISPRANTETHVNSETKVFGPTKVLDSLFNTENRLRDETFNFAFTLDYIHKFEKEGEKLLASLHHTNYDFSSFQNVDTEYLFPDETLIRNNRFQTFSGQKIKLYTGQIDYELPIDDSAQFEAGAKVSNINSESVLDQFIFNNGIREEDLENSDIFLYDEINYALYSSFSKDWDKWSLKSGLRIEYTDIKGNSLSTNQVSDNDYIKFFPSLYITNRINKNNEIYFNYNKRIYRPRYAQLNPFKYFLNDNAYVTGDPNLRPQIDDTFTLGYTFNQDFTFEVYYRFESDPTIQITFQDNIDNLIKYINTNIDQSFSYGFDFTTYTPISKNWNLYVLSSIYYYEEQFYALESNNELLANERWSTYLQVANYFTFLEDKSLIADVSYTYISPYILGPADVSASSGLDINFRKVFFNNRASLSLGVLDIFNSRNIDTETKYLNQDVFFKSRIENRLFTIGFNYKFGNVGLNSNKKEIDLDERDRLQNN